MGKNKDGANRTKGNVKVSKYDVSRSVYSLSLEPIELDL